MWHSRPGRVLPLAALLTAAGPGLPADAETVNYPDLFRARAIKCLHPTVDPGKASIEVVKGPDSAGDMTTIRLKVFYEGWLKKNAMDADMVVRQAGSIRQFKINVLADSGISRSKCALETNWTDF